MPSNMHDTYAETEAFCEQCGVALEAEHHASAHAEWVSQQPACTSTAPPALTGEDDADTPWGTPYRYGCERTRGHVGPHGALGNPDGTYEVTWS